MDMKRGKAYGIALKKKWKLIEFVKANLIATKD